MLSRLLFAAALSLSLCCVAIAQDKPSEYRAALQTDCAKELKSLCKGVKEGGGRVLSCLYAREDKLSAKCATTFAASQERLAEALTAIADVRRLCEADATRLCSGVVPGDGNLIDCLSKARGAVSSRCNETLDAAFLRP
jgi:hypothetical protein